ncbi:MAG: hypothetical protein OXU86_06575 [Thaumarchaeota archaeon]|nr:hypothetical protein [Nitrososphaerota archaeon]
MSEMERVNILPGTHGEGLWVRQEALESNEPLLEGCENNARRAEAIQRIRDELAQGGYGDRAGYARAFELLGMLTPTSSHGTWCKLRDELVRLGSKSACLVEHECELVRSDTLRRIRRGDELVPKLREECSRFLEARESHLHAFALRLEDMLRHVGDDAKGGEGVRRYTADMARFNSGADDGLVFRMIFAVYIEQGSYDEACAVCEEIVEFDGEDRDKMAASTLVERVVDSILIRVSESYAPERDDKLVQRCVDLLMRRSRNLGLNQSPRGGTRLHQASSLASNILARRRLRTAEEIDAWIRGKYPKSHRFLRLDSKSLGRMLESDARLAESASIRIRRDELAKARRKPRVPSCALDELERLITRLHERGIDAGQEFGDWDRNVRGASLWDALAEIRICLRFRLANRGVELHPAIGGGHHMGLLVDNCYVDVPPPEGGAPMLSRRLLDDERAAGSTLGRIMGDRRLDHVGDRAAVLLLDCSWVAFGSRRLRDRLASALAEKPQLSGAFLILLENSRYESAFVKNPAARMPVPQDTVEMMARVLGTGV